MTVAGVLIAVLGITVAWRGGGGDASDAGPQRLPELRDRSILLITVDTTRADRLEPYGATDVETPVLAQLARDGIVFESTMAVAPITLVAHASILTGLYPTGHGVRNNGIHYLADEMTTLAELLADDGWQTAAFVSAAVLERRYGLDQGFAVYDDDLSSGRNRHPRMVPDRPAEATVASVTSWLDGLGADQRFFAWVHFYDPHAAYSPPPPYRDRYRERLYDGEIAYMDAEIGRLLEHPRLNGDRAPIVTVLGDHGESLGEHGERTHAILAYESTMHVPWILSVPGGPKGLRAPAPVSQVDLVPTLLELVGVEATDGLDGTSLVSMLSGQAPPDPQRALYGETWLPFYTYGWAKLQAVRHGQWKLIDAPTPELYDLRRDPRELSNLYEGQPGVAHDLGRELEEMTEGGERETSLELDRDAVARLQALGYLGGRGTDLPDEATRADPKEMIGLHVDLERARQLIRDRLWRQAESRLQRVLERDPNNLAALIDLATAQEGAGDVEAAVQTVERGLRLEPDEPRLLLHLARVERSRGQPELALQLVDQVLAIDPSYRAAVLMQATILADGGHREAAREVLDGALAATPEDARVQTAYAQLVEMPLGEVDAARQRLHAALDRDPFLVLAWRLLGEIHEATGAPEAALTTYQEGLRKQPDDPELHARCGLLLARTGDVTRAEVHLREALRLSTGSRDELRVALGAVLAETGRREQALELYGDVLERNPAHPGARNNRAIALYRSGRLDEAAAELEALVRRHPNHADAFNNLAAIAVDQREWQRAASAARRATRLAPHMVEAWNNLGIALDELGELEPAEEAYRTALETNRRYWPARLNLGICLHRLGRVNEAVAELEAILEDGPASPRVHLELARLYFDALDRPELARRHANAFLRMAPRHPDAAEVHQLLAELG